MTDVRAAVAEDAETIGRFGAALVSLHHDFDPKRFIAADARTPLRYAQFLGQQIVAPDVIVLVAEKDGAVIGYAYAGLEGPDYMALRGPAGVIYDIFVDPAHRGEGVGRMLLDAALAALRDGGPERVVLSTAQKNEAAQRLFASRGFRSTMIEMTREMDDTIS